MWGENVDARRDGGLTMSSVGSLAGPFLFALILSLGRVTRKEL